jgi:phenol hydroxylase P5 protein
MSYELTIEPLGQTIEVEEGQTILDASLRAGIWLPHACCHGLCATCKVQVVDGDVDHGEASSFALMDFERTEGKTLACCARLESDVTIEAEIDEEPDAESIPVKDFPGTVTRIETLTPTIKGIFITLDEAIHFPGRPVHQPGYSRSGHQPRLLPGQCARGRTRGGAQRAHRAGWRRDGLPS